jgi:hypothetical protein
MDFYHGTQIGGLTELKPFDTGDSNLKVPAVYLTTRRQVALHYVSNYKSLPFRSPMLDIRENIVVYQEMYPDALELSCKGVNGYIYSVNGDFEMMENNGVRSAAVSYEPVPIVATEYIPCVYEAIMEYHRQGKFTYGKYEDLPQYRLDIIRGHFIRTLKRENLLDNPQHHQYELFRDKFPQYWKEAEVLHKYGLL